MEPMNNRRYPIGIQTFSKIREEGCIYIDKTEHIYKLTHSSSNYVFLSRPRRFGKSLLTSTLRSYFEGRKELFKGLAIEKLETEWTAYPVIHLDLSLAKHLDQEKLIRCLHSLLEKNESRLEIAHSNKIDVNLRLTDLIENTYQKTGKQVVVLIDEYDAPLLDVVHEDKNLPQLRLEMRNFFSPLKACDPYLKFVFLTGITKFSQLSIFSELNNIRNISMEEDYGGICGITEEEMITQMSEDLDILADRLKTSPEEVLAKLKDYYDGYHFTWPSADIYNPFSLLNAFASKKLKPFWFESGTPTYLLEMLRKFNMTPTMINKVETRASEFDAPIEHMTHVIPLLYQSGYITITDYDPEFQSYTLDIPNKEVRLGLMESFIPFYLTPNTLSTTNTLLALARALYKNDLDGALNLLRTFLSTIPYCENTDYEGHYQQVFYIIFSLLGHYADVEVRTLQGRIDVVLRTKTHLYVMELKLNQSAESALNQIELKNYPERFALCGLPIVKVGINFDKETHTLSDWSIQKIE